MKSQEFDIYSFFWKHTNIIGQGAINFILWGIFPDDLAFAIILGKGLKITHLEMLFHAT